MSAWLQRAPKPTNAAEFSSKVKVIITETGNSASGLPQDASSGAHVPMHVGAPRPMNPYPYCYL